MKINSFMNSKNAIKNNIKKIEQLIKRKQIHCSQHANGVGKIKAEDLSLYQDVVMVRDTWDIEGWI